MLGTGEIMGDARLPEGLVKLMCVVGALLVLPLLGAFLWGALGGTHQSYPFDSDEAVRLTAATVKCRECGDEAEVSEGMLPIGWWYTKTKEEMSAARGKPTCPKCLQPHFRILESRKLYDD
jgi:hypothetical protein